MRILYILITCGLSAIAYRMGGKGKPFNTKIRDIGCPLMLLGLTIALFGLKMAFWWVYLFTFGLSWGALTTYWDFLFKDQDNFYVHGLGCGLAALPLCLVIPWWLIVGRIIICTLGMGIWSRFVGNDVLEETGRGVLFIL